MPTEKHTSKNLWELTFEELLELPPDKLREALRESALHAKNIWLPPKDDPIFQEWLIFTLPRSYRSKNDTTRGSEDSET
jgi:hypothetical protein